MHLKDINNQYVVESVKESKSISKTNELKNQYRGQLSNISSQQIDSTKNLIKKKQKLMTIQQNESQDIKIGNAAQEVD
jgi:GTP1/Obg family GTP-binding protein